MTTIKLSGGDMGDKHVYVQCSMTRADYPVVVDYCDRIGWRGTPYVCSDTGCTVRGLMDIGKTLAALSVGIPRKEFNCDAEEIDT